MLRLGGVFPEGEARQGSHQTSDTDAKLNFSHTATRL